jgi:NADPH-dependent glutamate synthase beta subunit-like oxidoreductase
MRLVGSLANYIRRSNWKRQTRAAMRGQHHRLSDLASERALAGDMRRGQSLAVWAIREGRLCARAIDEFLTGTINLPR